MSVARYQPGKVREAAQEFEAASRQFWRGDKQAVIRQIEEMYAKIRPRVAARAATLGYGV